MSDETPADVIVPPVRPRKNFYSRLDNLEKTRAAQKAKRARLKDLIPPETVSAEAEAVPIKLDTDADVLRLARKFKRNKAALRDWLEEQLLVTMILESRDAQVPGREGSTARGRVFEIANATLAAMDRAGVEGGKKR